MTTRIERIATAVLMMKNDDTLRLYHHPHPKKLPVATIFYWRDIRALAAHCLKQTAKPAARRERRKT